MLLHQGPSRPLRVRLAHQPGFLSHQTTPRRAHCWGPHTPGSGAQAASQGPLGGALSQECTTDSQLPEVQQGQGGEGPEQEGLRGCERAPALAPDVRGAGGDERQLQRGLRTCV
jgi:hypothetical protein